MAAAISSRIDPNSSSSPGAIWKQQRSQVERGEYWGGLEICNRSSPGPIWKQHCSWVEREEYQLRGSDSTTKARLVLAGSSRACSRKGESVGGCASPGESFSSQRRYQHGHSIPATRLAPWQPGWLHGNRVGSMATWLAPWCFPNLPSRRLPHEGPPHRQGDWTCRREGGGRCTSL
ncbi:hypothetical protein CLOM_g15061 [Closterium sp. NIES-68]|nr:hypothetical protein CLOM_g22437 [Closterium sp. NIES-68]GJP56011.1 hypothetical protein CLOM_g15061 [Closterium sp. NIES-68]GJP70219.1 hypothetical protein CLOP_g1184 [Closterium sp. NIES-67]